MNNLSDDRSTVLYDKKDDKAVIAYRGTMWRPNIATVGDVLADAQVALGLHKQPTHHLFAAGAAMMSANPAEIYETAEEMFKPENVMPRLADAEAKYEKTRLAFLNSNIETVGHSLGGALSYHVATKHDLDGHHFNIGSSPFEKGIHAVNRYFHGHEAKFTRQHIYHSDEYKALNTRFVRHDPVSQGSISLAGNHHHIKVNSRTSLGVHNLSHFINSIHDIDISKYKYKKPHGDMIPNILPTPILRPSEIYSPEYFSDLPVKDGRRKTRRAKIPKDKGEPQ